jgi:hypothetical protein
MSTHTVDQSQPGGQVHRLEPGCSDAEPRVLTGQKITPEYVRGFAAELVAIQDPAAKAFCRRLLEVMLSRRDAAEVLDGPA